MVYRTMLVLALAAAGVQAQMFLPPGEKPADFRNEKWVPEFQRPEKQRLREALEEFQREKMLDRERRIAEREREKAERQRRINEQYRREKLMEEVGSIPFESLVWRDDSGKVAPLDMPPFYAALNQNPLVDPETLESAWLVLEDRISRLKLLVVQHPEVVRMIESGELSRVSITDFDALQRVQVMLKRIALPDSPGDELLRRGVLDDRQVFMNGLIVKDYMYAVRQDLAQDGLSNFEQAQRLVEPMLRTQAEEGLYAYELMLLSAANRLDEIAGRMTLDDGLRRLFEEARQNLDTTVDRSERLRVMSSLVRAMDLPQIRTFLQLAAGG